MKTVDEAIIALQKLQFEGLGKCELANKYDGMFQEIGDFSVQHYKIFSDGDKAWIPKDTSEEELAKIPNRHKAVRINTSKYYNLS
jgi:hypothetical protein